MANSFRTRFGSLCILFTMTAFYARANGGAVQPENFNLTAFVKASVNVLGENDAKIEAFFK